MSLKFQLKRFQLLKGHILFENFILKFLCFSTFKDLEAHMRVTMKVLWKLSPKISMKNVPKFVKLAENIFRAKVTIKVS